MSPWATHEFHWVFSTDAPLVGLRDDGEEGQLGITDGLGGALNRTINPKVIVRGQASSTMPHSTQRKRSAQTMQTSSRSGASHLWGREFDTWAPQLATASMTKFVHRSK